MTAPDETLPSVIVGLGNPGKKYEMTRHNLGFLTVGALAKRLGWIFREDGRFSSKVCKGLVGDRNVHLLLPQTYMNESGVAVRRYLDYYKMTPAAVLVITDDIALPFGQLRLRWRGSAGGHNGLKSIEAHLGTQHYARLRMGVGNPASETWVDFVLSPFSSEEMVGLEGFIERGVGALESYIQGNVHTLMNEVNRKNPNVGAGESE